MNKIAAIVLCFLMVVVSSSAAFAETTYTIVLPGWFESDDFDPTNAEQAIGAQFVERDSEGNYVFLISEEARVSAIADAEAQLIDTINQMVYDETGLIAVSKVEYNENLSQIDIYCEKDEVGLEALYAAFLPLIAFQYQILDGNDLSDFICTLTFYNPVGDVIETTTIHDVELQQLVGSMQEYSSTDNTSDGTLDDTALIEEQSAEIDVSAIIDLSTLSDAELKAVIIHAEDELYARHAVDSTEKVMIEFDGYDIDFTINSWRLVEYYDGTGIEFDVSTVNNSGHDIEIGMRDIEINGWLVLEDCYYKSITSLGAGKKMKDSFSISDWDMADVSTFEQIETIAAEIFLEDEEDYSTLATVRINWSMDDLLAIPHEE